MNRAAAITQIVILCECLELHQHLYQWRTRAQKPPNGVKIETIRLLKTVETAKEDNVWRFLYAIRGMKLLSNGFTISWI